MRYIVKKQANKHKVLTTLSYIAGSVVLSIAAIIAIPKIMAYVSGGIYKQSIKASNARKTNDDWGPLMEKKQ